MALINLRNALMTGKRLPYDAEVEYLESTGTQYIDTGVSGAEQNLIITAGVRINTFAAYAGGFGNYVSETTNCFRLILTASNNGQAYATSGYISNNSHVIKNLSLGNWHTVILNGAEDRCFCDGVEYTKPTRYLQGTANANTIRIFTSGGSAAGTWSKQISAFKVELNGVLVRDYIPVRKGAVGYLYDRVSGKLFGNAGTGDFVLGPDVVPVEYIESHGTEYIDTGVIASTDVSPIKIHFSPTATEQWLVGGGDSSSAGLGLCARGYDSSKISVGYGWTNTLTYWNRGLLPINIIGLISNRFYFNDYAANTLNFSGTYNVNFALFGQNIAGSVVPAKARIYRAEIGVCSFFPVRVGTDATSWEGAMMDVLTRKVYRNAGTGSFSYGNDLKYPIAS